jgi:outer membrane protein OmpA-like peptidoglycan-associated protein
MKLYNRYEVLINQRIFIGSNFNPKVFKYMNPTIRLFLTTFLLFWVSLSYAQIKKGFDYLRQKDYDNARLAFEVDLYDPVDGIGAKVGLAECFAAKNEGVYVLKEGIQYIREAEEAYGKLGSKDKADLRRYNITLNRFPSVAKKLQQAALKYVNQTKSVLDLDMLLEEFKPFHRSIEDEVAKTRMRVVQHAVRNAQDYKSLTSLVNNHYVWVAKTNYRYGRDLQQRLLGAFLKDVGAPNLDQFVADHPDHSFSIDCWVHEFNAAIRDRSSLGMLRFLLNYPMSMLNGFADMVLRQRTGNGLFFPEVATLTPEEKKLWDALVEGWQIQDMVEQSDTLTNAFEAELFAHLQKTAPTSRAYDLMKKALQKYLTNRQWQVAESLVKKSQPLFPDAQPDSCDTKFYYYSEKQGWFRVAIPIIEREAEGIYRGPVEPLNTPKGDEFSPVVSADGKTMYFGATNRAGNVGGEDVFKAEYDIPTREWGTPALLPELSTNGDESPLSLTSDGNKMLIFKDGKLCITKLGPQGWLEPEPMPDEINGFEWIGRAALSADGKVIIFSATEDPEEIYGESNIDLYVSRQDSKGNWVAPFKLGPDINTIKEERSPFLHNDNETLYFSSNGHKGLGGMDVYYSKRLDDTWVNWSVPKNLGKEINTLEDDWGYNYSISPIGNTVYLSADDIFSGLGDIYYTGLPDFVKPKEMIPICGKLETDSGDPLQTMIVITDAETGETIDEVQTRPDGSFTALVEKNSTITYFTKDEALFPVSRTVAANEIEGPCKEEKLKTVRIQRMMEENAPAPLNNILFDYDKDVLKSQSYPELNRLFELVKDKDFSIKIEGHTDNAGTPAYNKDLSLRRARAVLQFLEERGIAGSRMTVEGFGAEVPRATNDTDEGRAENRRVEIRFNK